MKILNGLCLSFSLLTLTSQLQALPEVIIAPEYKLVIDQFERIHQPLFQQRGLNLVIKKESYWTEPLITGHVDKKDRDAIIVLRGGLSAFNPISSEALFFVLCHEAGHHLGGVPNKENFGYPGISVEGQADYYAATKCLRTMYKDQNNYSALSVLTPHPKVVEMCTTHWADTSDSLICQRTMMAPFHFWYLTFSGNKVVDFNSPSTIKVESTWMDYPRHQCRLDTFVQGALCNVSSEEEMSDTDWTAGTCTKKNGFTVGMRPECWFIEPM